MNFDDYIGLPLDEVVKILEKQRKKYIVKENNFIISGDTKLVTNVKEQNGTVVLVVGDFIFNLKRN